jgi:DNA polymerase II small subunit/DNA polymerase delta subunit B
VPAKRKASSSTASQVVQRVNHICVNVSYRTTSQSGELNVSLYNTIGEVTVMLHTRFCEQTRSIDDILRNFQVLYYSARSTDAISVCSETLVSALPEIQEGVCSACVGE